jgi:hypothetical protein
MKKIIKLTESDLTKIVKRVIEEQSFDPKKDYLSKGYIDVTDGFVKDTYALQIPDGTYKCDGAGYSFKILSNDGKDTGYVVIMNSGIRGMITGPVTVSDNGVKVSLGKWNQFFNSLLYNEKLNQLKKVVKEQSQPSSPTYISMGTKFCFFGSCRVDIKVINQTTSEIVTSKGAEGKDSAQLYPQVIKLVQDDLNSKKITGVVLPTFEQLKDTSPKQ